MNARTYELPPRSILSVLQQVIAKVREDEALSAGLDGYTDAHPESDNVSIRWLSQKRGYEVTLKFAADPLNTEEHES